MLIPTIPTFTTVIPMGNRHLFGGVLSRVRHLVVQTKDLHLMSGSVPTESARSRVSLTLLAIGVAAVSTAAAPAHAQQAVVIVRHGEKAEAPKDNPPLSRAGQAR